MSALLALLFLCPAQEARQPKTFAVIYNQGYAADHLPKDEAGFEALVKSVKSAGFNVIWGAHDPKRAAICKKHGVLLFVDLVAGEHHVYKNVEAAKKLCESLRGDPTIYGYHLWSDNIANTYAGRSRDVANVRQWDPTHPAYVGAYRMSRVNRVTGMDLFGYYDFHWKRGGHWDHLTRAGALARERKVGFLRYLDPTPGLVGKGNPDRVAYTIATSLPFGLKGYTFHHAGRLFDARGGLTAVGKDLANVNARFAPVHAELMKLGPPTATFSTPITRSAKDDPLDKPGVPGGLPAVPPKHWYGLTKGEVLIGEFKDGEGRDVLVIAGHNAHQGQDVELSIGRGTAEILTGGKWTATKSPLSFNVPRGTVQLVRVKKR